MQCQPTVSTAVVDANAYEQDPVLDCVDITPLRARAYSDPVGYKASWSDWDESESTNGTEPSDIISGADVSFDRTASVPTSNNGSSESETDEKDVDQRDALFDVLDDEDENPDNHGEPDLEDDAGIEADQSRQPNWFCAGSTNGTPIGSIAEAHQAIFAAMTPLTFNPAMYAMPMMCAMPMTTDAALAWGYPQVMSQQDLEAQAVELEKAATRYAAAARQAESRARLARGKQEAKSAALQESVTEPCVDKRTTIMMRNLPNDYSRDMLLELLDSAGFAGRYDFIYLPVDFHRWAGFGYAFVNMVSNADAIRVRDCFDGYSAWSVGSLKICEVCWGEPLQGLEKHCDRYRNSPVMHALVPDQFKPAVFKNGVRTTFPAPTKRLRPPRTKTHPPSAGATRLSSHTNSRASARTVVAPNA